MPFIGIGGARVRRCRDHGRLHREGEKGKRPKFRPSCRLIVSDSSPFAFLYLGDLVSIMGSKSNFLISFKRLMLILWKTHA
jgi:hypothetical protein